MKFYTIFLGTENVHLLKDVGMIPFVLHKKFDFDSTLVTYKNGEYPYLKSEVKDLKIEFIKRRGSVFFDSILYLISNSRKIDVLQLYHFSPKNVILFMIFKLLNIGRNVNAFLKLDADDDILKLRLRGLSGNIFKYFITKIDLISVEAKLLYDQLVLLPFFKENLIYMPNGFYDFDNRTDLKNCKKENIVLSVSRIGTYQKNTELLVDAFVAAFDNGFADWKLVLVGSTTSKFDQYIKSIFDKFPYIKDYIALEGGISDKQILNTYYSRAKIFALPSRYEGFALVYLEALQFGCKILATNITPAFDVIEDDVIGKLFNNEDAVDILSKLQILMKEERTSDYKHALSIQSYAYNKFYWPKLLNTVSKKLYGSS